MYKNVLLIKNTRLYPEASKCIEEMKCIFNEMEYGVFEMDACDEEFQLNLINFVNLTKTSIECKAILSCNAIGIELIPNIFGGLYITYIEDLVSIGEDKLVYGNKNTAVFCSDSKEINYIKEKYSNIGNVLVTDIQCEKRSEIEFGEADETRIVAETQLVFDIQELIAVGQGKAAILKLLIERGFGGDDFQQVRKWIDEYRKICPSDMDLFSMETLYALYTGDMQTALKYALEGTRKYPCNADLYYNLGNVYENMQKWYQAWLAYLRSYTIYEYCKSEKIKKLNLKKTIANCRKLCKEKGNDENFADVEVMERNWAGLHENAFRSLHEQILGKYYWESETKKRYAGIYRDYFLRTTNNYASVVHTKGEFVEVTEGKEYKVPVGSTDVLLPVASANANTRHKMVIEEQEYDIKQQWNKHFNYYRIPAGTEIYSSDTAYYGKPIPLVHKQDKKKLVLNIFIDGLAQCILDGKEFIKNMPNTARFFGKGTVCTRAYNTAEWTYPSIVNYVTGIDTVNHMLFHNMLDWRIPEEYPTLAEYFQEKGYFTSKMCGNWRIIPTYGHARGYDQFIYQHQWQGYKAEMIIGEVIDHIEAFKDTDQFLWMSIGDLHDVADGIDMPNAVQSVLDIDDCVEEELGRTSVQQKFSKIKSVTYKKMVKRVDVLLGVLYRYLEENYKSEDIIVSLFSDHGQGYLIPQGEHFCAMERSKVAFMFKGANIKQEMCNEVISTSDYIQIMCKLADIKMKDIKIEGKLPRVFGGDGREYALTESIHPGDFYNAAIYSDDCVFYFTNPFPVQNDGRFYLKQYDVKLTDLEGNIIKDYGKYEKYLRIILEHIAPLCIYE